MQQRQIDGMRPESSAELGGLQTRLRMGVAWYDRRVRRRKTAPAEPWHVDLAVRRDWPEIGHDFVAFGVAADAAARWIARDAAFWRPGPVRPSYSLVQVSARDFYLHARHRPGCRAPDCPRATQAAMASGAGR